MHGHPHQGSHAGSWADIQSLMDTESYACKAYTVWTSWHLQGSFAMWLWFRLFAFAGTWSTSALDLQLGMDQHKPFVPVLLIQRSDTNQPHRHLRGEGPSRPTLGSCLRRGLRKHRGFLFIKDYIRGPGRMHQILRSQRWLEDVSFRNIQEL